MFVCGCASTSQNLFSVSGPGWRVQKGQTLWRPQRNAPEFGGDFVLAQDGHGDSFVQFDKMPLTLVCAEITATRWLIRFPQGGGAWSGRTPAPTRTIWLYLPAALAGQPLPPPLHFERRTNGGWRLDNARTGESLEGYLTP